MTDTETTAAPPVLAQRHPGRALVIAAIHSYAQWLADNPDVPVPTQLSGSVHPTGAPGDARQAALDFHANHGGSKLSGGNSAWVDFQVSDSPLPVRHVVFADDRPARDDW